MKDEQDHPPENVVFWHTSALCCTSIPVGTEYILHHFIPKAQMNFGSAHKATGWKHCVTEPQKKSAMDGAVASELLAKLTHNLQQPDLNVNRQLIHKGQDGKKMGKGWKR